MGKSTISMGHFPTGSFPAVLFFLLSFLFLLSLPLLATRWNPPSQEWSSALNWTRFSLQFLLSQKLKELPVNNINNHECPIIANIFPPFLQFPKCPTLFHIFPPNSQPWVPITSFPPALPVLPWWPSNAPNALVQLGALAPGTANG